MKTSIAVILALAAAIPASAQKIETYTATTAPASTDLLLMAVDVSGTFRTRKITLGNLGTRIGALSLLQPYDADLAVIGALVDPNADRLLFWDDSAGAYAYLALGSGLSITGTTITATGTGDALVANPLSQFAATTSLQFAGVITNETGTGAVVLADSPTLTTPILGVAASTSLSISSAVPYNATTWNGSLLVPSRDEVRDAFEAATVSVVDPGVSGVLMEWDDAATPNELQSSGITTASVVTLTGTQTLTNKTLTLPIIASISNGGTVTIPSGADTLVGKATTDTLTNKTFDAAGTGNVLKLKGYLYLTHPHLADGTGAVIGTTATAIDYGHATFSNSADQAANYVEYRLQVPTDIDTAVEWRAKLKVRLTAADVNTHRYVLSTVTQADSSSATGTVGTAINLDLAADASGASGDVETVGYTTLTGWAATMTADRLLVIRLARDGDAATVDASTVNSTELGLVLEYGVSQ